MGHAVSTHYDWYSELKAVHDHSVSLQWHSVYDDEAKTQAHTNLRFELNNITLNMFTGHEQYTGSVSQSMLGLHAYFQQVSDLAFKAFKLWISQYSLGYFHNLDQQDVEQFPEFLTPATNTVKSISHLALPRISKLNSKSERG